ncbi:hypothetical protein BC834DRAFT_965367 [Gloeopeniophorella convolvens]|nr:hypothetical protein BC834DRAFT_965367 [Gloeopeniophorella convolvens]
MWPPRPRLFRLLALTALFSSSAASASDVLFIDQNDPSVQFSSGWTTASSQTSLGGSFAHTAQSGASLNVTLPLGTAQVQLLGFSDPKAGLLAACLDCDTRNPSQLELFDANSPGADTPPSVLFTLAVDPTSSHTLFVINVPDPRFASAGQLSVDALVLSTETGISTSTLDDVLLALAEFAIALVQGELQAIFSDGPSSQPTGSNGSEQPPASQSDAPRSSSASAVPTATSQDIPPAATPTGSQTSPAQTQTSFTAPGPSNAPSNTAQPPVTTTAPSSATPAPSSQSQTGTANAPQSSNAPPGSASAPTNSTPGSAVPSPSGTPGSGSTSAGAPASSAQSSSTTGAPSVSTPGAPSGSNAPSTNTPTHAHGLAKSTLAVIILIALFGFFSLVLGAFPRAEMALRSGARAGGFLDVRGSYAPSDTSGTVSMIRSDTTYTYDDDESPFSDAHTARGVGGGIVGVGAGAGAEMGARAGSYARARTPESSSDADADTDADVSRFSLESRSSAAATGSASSSPPTLGHGVPWITRRPQ